MINRTIQTTNATSQACAVFFSRTLIAFSFACACSAQHALAQSAPASLTIQRQDGRLLAGDIIRLSFYAGSATQPVAGLFGLSFELRYSAPQFVLPVTPDQVVSGPFLEPNTYNFARHEASRKTVSFAVSRKLGAAGQYGSGEVLIYSFLVAPETPVGTQICFSLESVAANDSLGNAIPLVAGAPLCLRVEELGIEVGPNPFTPNDDGSNDQTEFRREGGIPPEWRITIMDREGRVVRRLTNGESKWNGRDEQQREMLPGVYLYMIQSTQEVVKRGVLALVR